MSYSKDLRKRALKFVQEGDNQAEAAHIFNLNLSTIYRWQQRKTLSPTTAKTRQRKLIKSNLLYLVKHHNDAAW